MAKSKKKMTKAEVQKLLKELDKEAKTTLGKKTSKARNPKIDAAKLYLALRKKQKQTKKGK